jgi:hypothetical protein
MNGPLQNEILHDPHDLKYLEDEEGFHGEVADYLEEYIYTNLAVHNQKYLADLTISTSNWTLGVEGV